MNRVVVGRFATQAEADAVRQRLARLGIAGLVRQGENL
ncbi:SPOR domain-containing protein [Hymenobacter sp. 5516J-16]